MVTINNNYFIQNKNKTKQTITNNNKNKIYKILYKLKYKSYYYSECYKITVFPVSNYCNKLQFQNIIIAKPVTKISIYDKIDKYFIVDSFHWQKQNSISKIIFMSSLNLFTKVKQN